MTDIVLDDASIAIVKAANLPISLEAIEEIIFEEDSSEWFYLKHYQHPEWPGGASGVTIAIGYDLGYATPTKIADDFGSLVDPAMLHVMIKCAGVTGVRAHDLLMQVRGSIVIPWPAALQVFLKRDMPQWIATAARLLPNWDKLGPTCKGIIVSLIYNRGAAGFNASGDRYTEMRAIKADMSSGNFADIPTQLRRMARLWTGGVHARRLREATLFERGLLEMKGTPNV
jgi:hypothetical protein